MARRRARELSPDDPTAAPQWVLESGKLQPQPEERWWKPWLKLGQELTADTWLQARRAARAAAEAWCEERGHSFCRVVLGWRHASPSEVAKGCTTVPGERP